MNSILSKIIGQKRKEIALAKKQMPLRKLKSSLSKSERSFFTALKGKNNIIAEIKFKSPSSGDLGSRMAIKDIVECYDCYASAISVLTDALFFGGKLEYLKEARKHTKLPILKKDFIIDPYQIFESRYFGADAVLLIAGLLNKEEIDQFLEIAHNLGMDCLVETKTEEEIKKVLNTNARIIGINNRNLSSDRFEIDLGTTLKLKKLIPHDKIIVSESGINTKQDILKLGTNAVLIGSSLMKSANIKEKLSSLHRCKVKICGITNEKDAFEALKLGADFLGFNFCSKSPRYISPKDAAKIIRKLPNTVQSVGIFAGSSAQEIESIAEQAGIDFVQLHSPDYNSLDIKGRYIIRMRRVSKEIIDKNQIQSYATLFDTFSAKLLGGTGKRFDISSVKEEPGKLFIAGGLNPENVSDVLGLVHPFCLDVCSGIEKEPGIKDKSKMKEFIQKVINNETKN